MDNIPSPSFIIFLHQNITVTGQINWWWLDEKNRIVLRWSPTGDWISPRNIYGLFRFLMESTVDRTTLYYQDMTQICQTVYCVSVSTFAWYSTHRDDTGQSFNITCGLFCFPMVSTVSQWPTSYQYTKGRFSKLFLLMFSINKIILLNSRRNSCVIVLVSAD